MRLMTDSGCEVLICCNQTKTVGMEECNCGLGEGCLTPADALARKAVRDAEKEV